MYEDAYLDEAYEMRFDPEMEYLTIDKCACGRPVWECETYEDCSEYN